MIARRSTANAPIPARQAGSLFLSESTQALDTGAHFLDGLTAPERQRLHALGRPLKFEAGARVFAQGTDHDGIFLIDEGSVRVFYTAPNGREITLAYWSPGHFIGGPEICGGGVHMWSGEALEECRITLLPTAVVRTLIAEMPAFALGLIDGLVAKGKCYSAMAQMLGTRSVIERLAQLLVTLVELYGVQDGAAITINRKVTHEEIAAIVGSTRQWVTMMLNRFKKAGIVSLNGRHIRIEQIARLEEILSGDGAPFG